MFSKLVYLFVFYVFSFSVTLSSDDLSEVHPRVIIGAGLSGLTTAHFLHENSTIFEAQDYIGGRIRTIRESGWSYERCATFIDQDHTELLALCKKFELPLNRIQFADRVTTVSFQDKLISIEQFVDAISGIESSVKQMYKVHQSNNVELTKTEAYDGLSPLCKAFLDTYTLDCYGIDFKDLSPIALSKYNFAEKLGGYATFFKKLASGEDKEKLNEVFYNYTLRDGEDAIISSLTKSLEHRGCNIKTCYILKRIEKSSDSYQLTFDNNGKVEIVRAKNVVITAPFSALRDVHFDASVPISKFQARCIQNLPYCSHVKVGAGIHNFSKIQDSMLYHLDLDNKLLAWPGKNALTLYKGIPDPNYRNDQIPTLLESTISYLNQAYKCDACEAFEIQIQDVRDDPYAKGTTSTLSKNANDLYIVDPEDTRRWLYAKHSDRLFFGGEHTMADGSQTYQEGAVRSGKIVASLLNASLFQ